ncbi:MAG: hypothetical protein K2Y25_03140, partial [Pseudomonadaceae bacterium]|nr:hypothetical protein [Pseudomonadaceae bacterium]
ALNQVVLFDHGHGGVLLFIMGGAQRSLSKVAPDHEPARFEGKKPAQLRLSVYRADHCWRILTRASTDLAAGWVFT